MLLSATTAGKHPKEQFDFFPLTIDVEERMYAAGRIPGSFFRREGRPSEDAILTCRLIDRPLRPTFKGLRNEVQVVITVMALNPDDLYDVLAINAASASTQISGLPFSGPIAGVRVALIDGQWVAFPTHTQLEKAVFDMVVAGRVLPDGDVAIMMVEAEATDNTIELIAGGATAPTEEVVAAGPRGRQAVPQGAVRGAVRAGRQGRQAGRRVPGLPAVPGRRLRRRRGARRRRARPGADHRRQAGARGRHRRDQGRRLAALAGAVRRPQLEIGNAFRSVTKKLVRQRVLRDKVRIDGRGLTDIRTLSAEVGYLPRVHGSALFERGETQILGVTTLNMLRMEQQLDTLSPETPQALHAQLQLPAVLHR